MKKASQPIYYGKYRIAISLIALCTSLFQTTPTLAQQVTEPDHVKWIRELEASGWTETDTIVTFDPFSYEEKIQHSRNDKGPQKDATGELIYQLCDQQPAFPGGQAELSKFLSANLTYPEATRKENFSGQVLVTFVVRTDGSLSNLQAQPFQPGQHEMKPRYVTHVLDSKPLTPALHQLLEREAARLVSTMPKWQPAKHRGQVVACRVLLPVRFKVD